MTVLKIIGTVLAAVVLLIFVILMLRAKVVFVFSTEGKTELKANLLFYSIYDLNKKKKKEKPGKIGAFLKRIFGIDTLTDTQTLKNDAVESGISGAVNKIVTILTLLAGQIAWLLKRVYLKKLRIVAVCGGGDAADAAMDYGMVCSTVYPFAGYLESTLKTPKNAIDIRAGCDFDGEAVFEIEIVAKIRVIHVVRAIWRNAMSMAYEEQAEA